MCIETGDYGACRKTCNGRGCAETTARRTAHKPPGPRGAVAQAPRPAQRLMTSRQKHGEATAFLMRPQSRRETIIATLGWRPQCARVRTIGNFAVRASGMDDVVTRAWSLTATPHIECSITVLSLAACMTLMMKQIQCRFDGKHRNSHARRHSDTMQMCDSTKLQCRLASQPR